MTNGTLGTIGIIGFSAAGSQYCYDASTCEATFALPSGVQVQLSATVPFRYVCPGTGFAEDAFEDFPGFFGGSCQQLGSVTTRYDVAVEVITPV